MKKLLFIATRQFWPASTGKETTLYYNCKGLNEKFGYDIYLFCFADKKADKLREKPHFIKEVKYVDTPSMKESFLSIVKNSFLFHKWPMQNSMFYSKKISSELNDFYEKVNPDVVIYDMVRLVPYAEILPRKENIRLLIEDDLLAKRYSRQMKIRGDANLAGYYSASLGGVLSKITHNRIIKNIALSMEIRRLDAYENRLTSLFDYITFISPIETREFNKNHKTDKAITLTMGADVNHCVGGEPNEKIENSMSIIGNFSYAPNADSLVWINDEVFSKLSDNISYHVIGKCPEELKIKITDKRINLYGFVDDPRGIVKSTTIYFAPILYGTGIKTKIVEAMAMGMVVITNSVGAEGLDVKNGTELLICETAEEFVDCIKWIMADEEKRRSISASAREYAVKNHDWDIVYESFGKMGL